MLFVLSQFGHFFVRTLINEWALPVSLDQRLINEEVWLGVVLRNFSVLQFGIQTHPGGRVVSAEIFFVSTQTAWSSRDVLIRMCC